MQNNIFEKYLITKFNSFIEAFSDTAEQIFIEKSGKLIQPHDFGVYRENICKGFIRNFISSRLEIGSGFLINTFDSVGTQCDIIVYDKINTPKILGDNNNPFFTVETVAGIGEIKSAVTKNQLKEAINKLARNKMLKQINHPVYIFKDHYNPKFDPANNNRDTIFSFVVCKKFDFDYSNIQNEIASMYDDDIPIEYRHNLILSVEDGLLCYFDDKNKSLMYPKNDLKLKNRFVKIDSNKYIHLKLFSSHISIGINSSSILYPEITDYMGTITGGFNFDQDN